MQIFAYLMIFITSFLFANWVIPKFIPHIIKRKIVGKDVNKLNKPKIPELGGLLVFFGFVVGVMISLFFYSYTNFLDSLNLTTLFAAFATISIMALLGTVDDLLGWKKGISKKQHALIPIFAALPLMVLPETIGFTEITIPFLGPINLGILYSILVVPIAVTGASNATNMLAGLNGLEAGLGSIIAISFIVITLMTNQIAQTEVLILLLSLLGALFAFFRYNRFPAKIFPGDSLTLMLGATFAAVSIIGNMEKIGVFLFALYFIELGFKAKHKMQSECYGIPQKNGTLKARPEGGSLTQFIMKHGQFKETEVVKIILCLQMIISGIIILWAYLNFIL